MSGKNQNTISDGTGTNIKFKVGLNLGCGPLPIVNNPDDGIHWLNVDHDTEQNYYQIAVDKGADFIWYDLREINFKEFLDIISWEMDKPDNISIVMINMSEFFEHLNLTNGVELLKVCYELLDTGGIIRISVPDFKLLLNDYIDGKMDKYEDVQPAIYKQVDSPTMKLALIALGTLHCIIGAKTYVETESGQKYIKDITSNDKVLSHDGNYYKIKNIHTDYYHNDIYTIEYEYNRRSLTVTQDHKIQILRDGEKLWVFPYEINHCTDYVLMPEYFFNKCVICNNYIPYDKKTCSRKCTGVLKTNNGCVNISCVGCGVSFRKQKWDNKKYCTKKCANKNLMRVYTYRMKQQFKKMKERQQECLNNPEYRKKLKELSRNLIDSGVRTVPEGFKNIETQKKARLSLYNTSRNGSIWQKKVYDYIIKYYPTAQYEYYVKGEKQVISNQFKDNCGFKHKSYFLDIAIPELKIDIEIDGEKWHVDTERDKRRDVYLTNNGWKIIRIPVRTIANMTYTDILTKELPQLMLLQDPPVQFIPVKIKKVIKKHVKKTTMYCMEVYDSKSYVAGGIINHNCDGSSGHKMLYDYDALYELLSKIGFKNIERQTHNNRYEAEVASNHEVIIQAVK